MKFLDDLPLPVWIGAGVATLRAFLDWKKGIGIWQNLRHIVLTYGASMGVAYLAFMSMETPHVPLSSRDTVVVSVITFFGINIVNSLRSLGEELERNPLQFLAHLITVWRTGKAVIEEQEKDKLKESDK